MSKKLTIPLCVICIAFVTGIVLFSTGSLRVYANDSAASVAAGGLQLIREPRISMDKERLTIGVNRVRVEYEFRNPTNQDVATEIAFPIPDYKYEVFEEEGRRSFDDFKLWVEGQLRQFAIDVRALVNGADRTAILRTMGIDIATFDEGKELSLQRRSELAKLGLMDAEGVFPQWTVHKTYHWPQTFRAHQVLHVAHEYKPVLGFMPVSTLDLDAKFRQQRAAEAEAEQKRNPNGTVDYYIAAARDIDQVCVEPSLKKRIEAETAGNKTIPRGEHDEPYLRLAWVDYILTTANSWKTPIKEFELVVERPHSDSHSRSHVSLCWDGTITQPTPDHFVSRVKDFVPTKELRVGFLSF